MATPPMLVQTANAIVYSDSPGAMRFNTFHPDGTVLDVSSGYTVETLGMIPAQSPNAQAAAQALLANTSQAFDATGVTVSWTSAQASAISSSMKVQGYKGQIFLSNDAGTTESILGTFGLTADQLSVTI